MEISVAQAADALGVSERRVRQLVAAGRVRARRLGGMWLVDGASLPSAPRRTRPLSPSVAWALLASTVPPASHAARWRERRVQLLDDPEPARLLESWAAARADRILFATREPGAVLDDPRVVRSGVSDPRSGLSAVGVVEGYVRRDDVDDLRRQHLLRSAPDRPNVILHAGDHLPGDPVPALVLAADLVEHQGPREVARATELIHEAVSA